MAKTARLLMIICWLSATLHAADYVPADYVWTSQSRNSSASMPCGGHDIGMNVWVENGDILFYISQSGWFDENNTLLKAGRWRIHLGDGIPSYPFEQRLCLDEGSILITSGDIQVSIWADVHSPVVYVDMRSARRPCVVSYESWRHHDRNVTKAESQQCSYKWQVPKDCLTRADSIQPGNSYLTFTHKNRQETVFDYTVTREHLDVVKDSLHNPLGGREMSGRMTIPGFTFSGTSQGEYALTDYQAWTYTHPGMRHATITIHLNNGDGIEYSPARDARQSRQRSARWWHAFWQRSWIKTDGSSPDAARMARNYELMRYLLGCNAYGQWPSKFNGGLFTFDPVYVEPPATETDPANPFTPDYRKWGGGTMTAQNQRLVYWPMLKSGDLDMMESQWSTYLRMLPNALVRTRHYWGHGGASFTEQTENFGLPNPAEYGKHQEGMDYGVEHNAWLEYEWDTVLEFCMMIIEAERYHVTTAVDSLHPLPHYPQYEPLIDNCLRFFDEHYQYIAKRTGAKALTDSGKLVIYPGSGCETYKMAYNPSSTIAALRTLASAYSRSPLPLERIPDIPLRVIDGDTCIAPAVAWARIQNVETPQLYPVFPWRIYGLGREGLGIAVNTYCKDPHALAMRDTKGWKQDNIWAACLGLTDEARRLSVGKFADGPYRFPAFWEPGFDWAPDLNRGGSAMIGLQEMLLQETGDSQLLLFPSWPREWNVSFRLHASGGRVVEAHLANGVITHSITTLPQPSR